MKKIFLLSLFTLFTILAPAQSAKQAMKVLDKTAAVVGRKGGAQADFTASGSKIGSQSGTIAIKGNMFQARTPKAIVWYNGKTQWSYLKMTLHGNPSTVT